MQPAGQNPPKRRRKSRFSSSVPSETQTSTKLQPSSTSTNKSQPENPAVAALRARTAAARRPQTNENPPKRRRTRFSAADSDAPETTRAAASPKIDVTAIPIAPVSTLRINRDAAKQRKVAKVLKISDADLVDVDPRSNPYYDKSLRLPQRPARPQRKDFNFYKEGVFLERAEHRREQAVVEARSKEYRERLVKSNSENASIPILPPLAEDLRVNPSEIKVPQFEWWDLPLLTKAVANAEEDPQFAITDITSLLRTDRITHYIHHPLPITPVQPEKPPPVLPLMLTKKEMKKLRRQRRMEAQKEKQEMIAVGLLQPDPPKVKLSNMMRVLANEVSADPTKVEAQVRAQMEDRRRKHEEQNEANKKTKEERLEKTRVKLEKDREDGLRAAVFRVKDMTSPQHRFKVDMNARQLKMTGVLLVFPVCNVVVVEGGAKSLRKYKKLMLRRINWSASTSSVDPEGVESHGKDEKMAGTDNKETEVDSEEANSCVLVWEGPIAVAAFEDFSTINARTQRDCRHHLRKCGVEHYWDLCVQANPVGNENLGVRQLE